VRKKEVRFILGNNKAKKMGRKHTLAWGVCVIKVLEKLWWQWTLSGLEV
jgi:hypothetical protein